MNQCQEDLWISRRNLSSWNRKSHAPIDDVINFLGSAHNRPVKVLSSNSFLPDFQPAQRILQFTSFDEGKTGRKELF